MKSTAERGVRGERVRALRSALGWTQAQLAERGGLTESLVASVETGRNKLGSRSSWLLMATAFGLSAVVWERYLDGELPTDLVALRVRRNQGKAARA